MLANAVLHTFPADKADQAADILRELGAASRAEPGHGLRVLATNRRAVKGSLVE